MEQVSSRTDVTASDRGHRFRVASSLEDRHDATKWNKSSFSGRSMVARPGVIKYLDCTRVRCSLGSIEGVVRLLDRLFICFDTERNRASSNSH